MLSVAVGSVFCSFAFPTGGCFGRGTACAIDYERGDGNVYCPADLLEGLAEEAKVDVQASVMAP